MTRTQWPTPAQIGAYLTTRGWRFDRPMKQSGAVYVYQHSEDGEVELFVPHFTPNADPVEDFASSVMAVVDTMKALEQRSGEAILADMLATDPAPAPRTPPQPVP
jgi:hypothetical protein